MNQDDELRARLARLDPQAAAPVDPVTGPRARHLLEKTMTETTTTASRRTLAALASAAAVLAAVGGGVLLTRDSADPVKDLPAKSVLALTDPGGGGMASCMMLSPELVRGHDLAFAGHVTSVDGSTVHLDVSHWFKGGTADEVTVTHEDPTDGSIASETLTLENGKDYLIATSGTALSICSGSGEDTPELRTLFDQAFPTP